MLTKTAATILSVVMRTVVGLALPEASPSQWSKRQSMAGNACMVIMQFRLQLNADWDTVPQLVPPLQITFEVSVAAEQIEGEASKITIQGMLIANNPFRRPNFDHSFLMAVPPSRLLLLSASPL